MRFKKFVLSACFIVVLCFGAFSLHACSSSDEVLKASTNLSHYDISVDFLKEDMTLECHEKLNYVNSSNDVLDSLSLHLYPNAFRDGAKFKPVGLSSFSKAYPNGKSFGDVSVGNVRVLGENVLHEISGEDMNILIVPFKRQVLPNAEVLIEIDFKVKIPNVNHRFGFGEGAVNLGNFYPIACRRDDGAFETSPYSYNGDPFYSDMANYDVKITADKEFVIAGTGENMAEKTEGNKKTSSFSAKTVRDFALVLSQKFRVLEHFEDGVKIKYYYYKDEKPSESLKTGALALATFSDMIGKYPYSTFSIVETNFVHGGMEYPNLIYISDSLSSYEEYTNVIVHETAHQWFYNMVGSNANVSSWLDEGLTEYVTACFYESNPQYLIEKKKIVENALSNYSLFVSVYGNVFGEVDTSMNRRLNEFKSEAEYVYVVYVKGMLLFDSLKSIVGEKDFLKGLKNYFENNKFGIAEPKNLISEFEKASRKDLSTFFDTWIGGKIVIVSLN